MNGPLVEHVSWSRRRWVGSVLVIFAVQVLIAWRFGGRPPERAATASAPLKIYFMADPRWAQRLASLPTLADPTILALPHSHGFSGAAWLDFVPADRELTGWNEPARWLPLNRERLGDTYSRFVASNAAPPLLIANVPLGRRSGELQTALDLPETNSLMRLEGALARLSPVSPVMLPSWPSAEILVPTVVRTCVNPAGDTVSAAILNTSGDKEADAFALQTVRGIRFAVGRAVPQTRLIWGDVSFQWHSLPKVVATNRNVRVP